MMEKYHETDADLKDLSGKTIADELYDAELTHILVRHEQAAVHAADGYARAI